MSSCRRSPEGRAPRPGQLIAGPQSAAEVVLLAVTEPRRPETIVICLDHAHRGSTVVVVDHPESEPVEQIAELFFQMAAPGVRLGAMVLATVRRGGGVSVVPADELVWLALRAEAESHGVELLDWLLVSDDHVVSMSLFTDSHCLWRDPDA